MHQPTACAQLYHAASGSVAKQLPLEPERGKLASQKPLTAEVSATHGQAITLRMRPTISQGQWKPWTAVSPLLELISMAEPSVSAREKPVCFFFFRILAVQGARCDAPRP